MSQEKLDIENLEEVKNDENNKSDAEQGKNAKQGAATDEIRLEVKKKRFKKSDMLVFGVCVVTSVLIWLYASNSQKLAAEKEKEISKEAIAEAVESGINKTTEASTEVAE